MPTLSRTIQMTRSNFDIEVPRWQPPLCPSPHFSTTACALRRLPGDVDRLRKAQYAPERTLSGESLNFFACPCVLESEEVCDGSKQSSPALIPCYSDSSDCGRWADPVQQLAPFL